MNMLTVSALRVSSRGALGRCLNSKLVRLLVGVYTTPSNESSGLVLECPILLIYPVLPPKELRICVPELYVVRMRVVPEYRR